MEGTTQYVSELRQLRPQFEKASHERFRVVLPVLEEIAERQIAVNGNLLTVRRHETRDSLRRMVSNSLAFAVRGGDINADHYLISSGDRVIGYVEIFKPWAGDDIPRPGLRLAFVSPEYATQWGEYIKDEINRQLLH